MEYGGLKMKVMATSSWLPQLGLPNMKLSRSRSRRWSVVKVSVSSSKIAKLSAARKERIKLPDYDGDGAYHISDFLRHPSGIKAMLNTSALHTFQFLHHNTYRSLLSLFYHPFSLIDCFYEFKYHYMCRCTLPKLRLFNFEAAPVIDLRVTPTNERCLVELLSCNVTFNPEFYSILTKFIMVSYLCVAYHMQFEGSDILERQNDHFSGTYGYFQIR